VGEKIRVSVISESQFTPAGHGVHTAFLEHVSYLTRCEGVQLDVNRRGNQVSDVIHVHTVGPYALLLLSTTRTVRIVTAHLLPESLMGSVVGAPWLQPLARRYFPWFYNRADIVIAVSDHVKEALLDLGVKKPIFVLGNSIDVESVANARTKRDVIRYRLGLGQKDFLVLSVGQLQPRKGILEFLRFAEQLPSVKFVWVGGPIFGVASAGKTELYRAIDSAPANFSYTGPISRDKVFEYLGAADVYVSMSTQETFGTAVLEAAAAGLPLVLSNLPAFHNVYKDAAQFGHEGDAVSLIAALTRDPKARAMWGGRTQEIALQHDRALIGEMLVSLYARSLWYPVGLPICSISFSCAWIGRVEVAAQDLRRIPERPPDFSDSALVSPNHFPASP
jgi:1,2-diacylglycerol-3-alpha-glucose alpha-1,2-galactosyltransferase